METIIINGKPFVKSTIDGRECYVPAPDFWYKFKQRVLAIPSRGSLKFAHPFLDSEIHILPCNPEAKTYAIVFNKAGKIRFYFNFNGAAINLTVDEVVTSVRSEIGHTKEFKYLTNDNFNL